MLIFLSDNFQTANKQFEKIIFYLKDFISNYSECLYKLTIKIKSRSCVRLFKILFNGSQWFNIRPESELRKSNLLHLLVLFLANEDVKTISEHGKLRNVKPYYYDMFFKMKISQHPFLKEKKKLIDLINAYNRN